MPFLKMLVTPLQKHCPRVIFGTHTRKWTKDTHRSVPKFTVSAACMEKKPARSEDQGNLESGGGEVPVLGGLPSVLQDHPSLGHPVRFLCCISCGISGPAVGLATSPPSHAGLDLQSQVLEMQSSLAWLLAQNECLMNIY